MIAVVQRVSRAAVTVEEPDHRAEIGRGLCVLLCAEQGDTETEAQWMAAKLSKLRIFADDDGKMNRSVTDVAGEVLLISQFTLAGDCAKGNRPSFVNAADPSLGEALYERTREQLRDKHNITTKTGIFGAMMQVEIHNDGPVTLIVRK